VRSQERLEAEQVALEFEQMGARSLAVQRLLIGTDTGGHLADLMVVEAGEAGHPR